MYNAFLLNRDQVETDKWEAFIDKNANDVIYFHAWFLDAVSPGWKSVVVEENGCWLAVMPLHITNKYFISYSLQPMYCKYLGTVSIQNFKPPDETAHRAPCEWMKALLDQVPSSLKYINWSFYNANISLSALRNENYNIEQRHTYELPLTDESLIFSTSITNHVRKALKNGLSISEGNDPELLIKLCLNRRIINRKGARLFCSLWHSLKDNNKGRYYCIMDDNGNLLCAAVFAKQGDKVFMILSAINSLYKQVGANSLLLSEVIKIYKKENIKYFCFEGSMYENVAKYLKGFKPETIQYYNITRSKSFLFQKIASFKKKWWEMNKK